MARHARNVPTSPNEPPDWDVLWRLWYCLGRQHHPAIAVDPRTFAAYLGLHRPVILDADLEAATAANAYLVAAALDGNNDAAAALLRLPAQDGRSLEECLDRVARRRCAARAADIVAELVFRWYNGTPHNPIPLLARWPPTGDFCRYWLISIKRLAMAESQRDEPLQSLPEAADPADGGAGDRRTAFRSTSPGGATSWLKEAVTGQGELASAASFVDCFVKRLAASRHGARQLCVVAIASQITLDAKLRQKQVAALLGVSEPTITRDVRRIVDAQQRCIELLRLEDEVQQAWWWADVRAITAESPPVAAAARTLRPAGDVRGDGG